MTFLDSLYIVGSIASIGSALVAGYKARKARGSAEAAGSAAKKVEAAFRKHRDVKMIARIEYSLGIAKSAMNKYGSAATEASLRGVDHVKDGEKVQESIAFVRENANVFGRRKSSIVNSCAAVDTLITDFVRATTTERRLSFGNELLREIDSLSSVLKRAEERLRPTAEIAS